MSVNLELNSKISELNQWETDVREICETSCEDKAERKKSEKSIIESLKGALGELFYCKGNIQKQIEKLDQKAEFHKQLRNTAMDKLNKIVAKMALS